MSGRAKRQEFVSGHIAGSGVLRTCNFVWEDRVEDFSLFFLVFDTHL